jgi:Na+:H+ antiporter, NhaA family
MKRRIARVLTPVQEFWSTEAASGIALAIASVLALAVANSPWHHVYEEMLHTSVRVGIGSFEIDQGLSHWINDFLMAIFFLLIGLEIKREIRFGELSDPRSAMLPAFAAVLGAAIPATIFLGFAGGTEFRNGWAIPMATDIAFALGVLALLGNRVPSWAKIFLMASAVVDDLIAVLVIAIFYTANLNLQPLFVGVGLLAILAIMNYLDVKAIVPYLVVGLFLWVAFFQSGVHATVAGVLLGFMVPAFRKDDAVAQVPEAGLPELVRKTQEIPIEQPEVVQAQLTEIDHRVREVSSPLHRLEHMLHPFVAFGIMPVFAFANAGVDVNLAVLSEAVVSPMAIGIALGLFVGKQLGIVGAWVLLAWLGRSTVPLGKESFRTMHGLSLVAGIGFTMSLFVGGLAYGPGPVFEQAKIAVLAASLVAGGCGFLILRTGKPAESD